jgi:hypothetical protein
MAGRVRRLPQWLKRLSALLALPAVAMLLFPGRRLGLALTLATGLGRGALQERVDELEAKAIERAKLSAQDERFLRDLYGSLAIGGKLSIVIRQTGEMMDHYLAGSDYRLEPVIFTGNQKVEAQARLLRERVARSGCRAEARLSNGPKIDA